MDNPEQFEKVFIADISVNVELAKQFPDNFILLDHHDSAKQLDGINKCIVDTSGNHCGATLCYKHLLMDEGFEFRHLTKLVTIALDYDLWHHKLPNHIAKDLNFMYYRYWGEEFIEKYKNGFNGFTEDEKEYLAVKWKEIEEEIKTAQYIDVFAETNPELKNKFCMIVLPNAKGEVNELCEYAIKNLGYEVILTVNPFKKKLSTRASKHAHDRGLHIGEFHMKLNIGGGHPQAGGAQYSDDAHLEKICEALAEKILEHAI
jgi:oligoribonuclease NrnB/cAMP/cGMP phosphodiesterase (DHH superfamily)